jgi:mannose-6-phosphate isomerase-like protein (cupin superfamily)
MVIISVNEANRTDNPYKIDARKLYDHDNAQVIHIAFGPGESLKPHITPVDVFFYILEGMIDVQVGDETVSLGKDNLVESPKDIVHCLSNNSGSVARVLVVKAPKPNSAAKMV